MKLPLPKLPGFKNTPHFDKIGFVPGRDEQARALEASKQTEVDTYDLIMQVMSILGASVEFAIQPPADLTTAPLDVKHLPLKASANAAQGYVDYAKKQEAEGDSALTKLSDKRNPLFDEHEIEVGRQSPVTQAYLVSRRRKKVAGSVFQAVGDVLNFAPHPASMVPGSIYHGQASLLTMMHMARLGYIAHQSRGEKEIQDWCTLIETMKAVKLGTRGTQFVGSVIPAASLPASILAAVIKAGVKFTWTGACYAAAAQLMYTAYTEQWQKAKRKRAVIMPPHKIPRVPVPDIDAIPGVDWVPAEVTGPQAGAASAIVWEIFTKRGATRLFGAYDIAALVREPAGWMALGDKFMLI